MYCKRELDDIVPTVGDESLFAHKVVLAMASKMWRAEFGWSGMAESQSKEAKVEDVSFATLKSIVDFAYTGKLELSGSSVVAIIQAANLLKVVAVERAAVDFLVERLDAGNILSAIALGAHLSAGEIGRDLRDKSRAWLNKNFGLVAAESSFLKLPVTEVVAYVESDELECPEEDVFAAVMAWVKKDEAERKGELSRLLPLVRFPMMADAPLLMKAEPVVVAQHPLAFELLSEAHPAFARSADTAVCPRLRPRRGQQLGGTTPHALRFSFNRWSADCYDVSGDDAATLRSKAGAEDHAAVCAGHVMAAGRHAVECTVVEGSSMLLEIARPEVDVNKTNAWGTDQFLGISSGSGCMYTDRGEHDWEGPEEFEKGDVVGLLLDCDAGTLTVKKNGTRLGVARIGLAGQWCWATPMRPRFEVPSS
jgi:hypothetical protein